MIQEKNISGQREEESGINIILEEKIHGKRHEQLKGNVITILNL